MNKKCRCCYRIYTVGVDGGFCSESCKQIQIVNYRSKVREILRKLYTEYFG